MKRTILILALAALGVAYPAGLNGCGLSGVGLNGIGLNGIELNGAGLNGVGLQGCGINGAYNNVGLGTTVAETVVTPFHRTDAVAAPGRRAILHTSVVPEATSLGFGNGYVSGAPFLSSGSVGFLGNAGLNYAGLGEGFLGGAGVMGTGVGGAGVLGAGVGGAGLLGTGIGGAGFASGACTAGW